MFLAADCERSAAAACLMTMALGTAGGGSRGAMGPGARGSPSAHVEGMVGMCPWGEEQHSRAGTNSTHGTSSTSNSRTRN